MRTIYAVAVGLCLATSANAESSNCLERHLVTLRGTVVQSAYGHTPYMALVMRHPVCDYDDPMIAVDASKKWLGHHVVITGKLGIMADREWATLSVEGIMDDVQP